MILVACGSKVNQANFDKIQTGMTQEEVIAILGSPSESSSIDIVGLSGTSSEWISKEGTISIQFVNKKVRAKRFSKTSN